MIMRSELTSCASLPIDCPSARRRSGPARQRRHLPRRRQVVHLHRPLIAGDGGRDLLDSRQFRESLRSLEPRDVHRVAVNHVAHIQRADNDRDQSPPQRGEPPDTTPSRLHQLPRFCHPLHKASGDLQRVWCDEIAALPPTGGPLAMTTINVQMLRFKYFRSAALDCTTKLLLRQGQQLVARSF